MPSIMEGGWFSGKKTYLTVGLTVVATVIAYLFGTVSLIEGVTIIAPMVGINFARMGIAKVEKSV